MNRNNIAREKLSKKQNDKVLLSLSALNENIRINSSNFTVENVVKEYINLPFLPINKEIIIGKIGVYNHDTLKRESKIY